MARTHALMVGLALATAANAQVDSILLSDLRREGPGGAQKLFQLFAAARDQGQETALAYAQALSSFGTDTHSVIDRLLKALEASEEPTTSLLLRALGNGALMATPEQQNAIRAATNDWAAKGRLYSPDENTPTFAWYEYVRLMNRLRLADFGDDAKAAVLAMDKIRLERSNIAAIVAGLNNKQGAPPKPVDPFAHCALEAFGSHGQREWLEAIAETAIRCRAVPEQLVDEFSGYLHHSPPREPRIVTEHCAGIGEGAPNQLPGVKWPTKWRYDDWHFACARAVLEHSKSEDQRQLARRHLLYERDPFRRREAIRSIRMLPQPWTAYLPDLTANLVVDDRDTVREALITLGMAGMLPPATRTALHKLADSPDRELRTLAKRLLK